ncbi:MAG: VTT domain-containing protein [Ilumatobacteraceae bacterium]
MDLIAGGIIGHALLAALVASDSVLPLVPSEAVVVAASAIGGPAATLGVVASVALGALAGDVFVHVLGRRAHHTRLGRWLGRRRWGSGGPGRTGRSGAAVVVWGRFVPGGRTLVSFVSGATGMRWRTYLPAAAAGSLLWAVFVTSLGRIGSHMGVSTPVSIAIGVAIGLVVCPLVAMAAGRRRRRGRVAPSGQRQGHLAVTGRELATQDGGRGQ